MWVWKMMRTPARGARAYTHYVSFLSIWRASARSILEKHCDMSLAQLEINNSQIFLLTVMDLSMTTG
jgi:hypothetical protein